MRGFVLAGTRSGVGKTVASLAVIRALETAGKQVQPAKAGPDFIDPSHHEQVAGRPSRTLDCWLEGADGLRRNYHRGEGEVCVVEGVMGLYDGDGSSTARVAEALQLPVVLVVDAKAGMESVAATAHGFRSYADRVDRDIDVVGVLAQRAHGGRHEDGIRDALPTEIDYFGRVPPDDELSIPDRHLGLHMGSEAPIDEGALDAASETVDVDGLIGHAAIPPRPDHALGHGRPTSPDDSRPRIAVARDRAFCFTYPATLERFRDQGDVVTFSPIAGDSVPDCDGIYLPGGYPEEHASELTASSTLSELHDRATEGVPVYGECGGLMALTQSLTTTDGERHEMAAVLPGDVEMCDRYQALDHVELTARSDTLTAGVDERRRGHEFHYSRTSVDSDARFAFDVERGDGIDGAHDGLTEYRTLGTYCHVHPESGAFDTFLEAVHGG